LGLLDEAIQTKTTKPSNKKLDRILAALHDFDEFDRLHDMIAAPVDQWGHTAIAGILRHVCDELGVDHEDVNSDNVQAWRDMDRLRRERS
jgi:hypothetical protein